MNLSLSEDSSVTAGKAIHIFLTQITPCAYQILPILPKVLYERRGYKKVHRDELLFEVNSVLRIVGNVCLKLNFTPRVAMT